MSFFYDETEDAITIRFPERKLLGNDFPNREEFFEILSKASLSGKQLIVDLDDKTFVSSANFGRLIQIIRACGRHEVSVAVRGISPNIAEAIRSLNLNMLLDFDD